MAVLLCALGVQLELEAMKPGLVPVRTFCEASDEEVESAHRQHTEANKAFNKRSSKATLDKAIEEIDKALRDSTFDPFLVRTTAKGPS